MKFKSIGLKITLVVVIISLLSLIVSYTILQFYKNKAIEDVYSQVVYDLQVKVNQKIRAKKDVGISNAVSIANDG